MACLRSLKSLKSVSQSTAAYFFWANILDVRLNSILGASCSIENGLNRLFEFVQKDILIFRSNQAAKATQKRNQLTTILSNQCTHAQCSSCTCMYIFENIIPTNERPTSKRKNKHLEENIHFSFYFFASIEHRVGWYSIDIKSNANQKHIN